MGVIGFAGLSHLGIVSSVVAASKGFDVVAYDGRQELCDALSAGQPPILEPGLNELLAAAQHRIRFTARAGDLAAADVVYYSLDVATDADNGSDLSALELMIETVVPHAKTGAVLVVLSQVPPGFTRRLAAKLDPVLRARGLMLYGQVETLIFGAAVERAARPERYIVGSANPGAALREGFAEFLGAYGCPVLVMRYESAELAKISINLFLAASLSTTNTLAELCEVVGADWSEIAPTLRLDRRIGPYAYLAPGLGIAGGNIERDLVTVKAVASEYGTLDCVAQAYMTHSRHRRDWVVPSLHAHVLSGRPEAVVAIWGLAYKVNTHSTKNSPTLALLDALPGVTVRLYDPRAILNEDRAGVTQCASALDACRGADALVIMTAWDEFLATDMSAVQDVMTGKVVIDPAAAWSRRDASTHGFVYATLGRGTVTPDA